MRMTMSWSLLVVCLVLLTCRSCTVLGSKCDRTVETGAKPPKGPDGSRPEGSEVAFHLYCEDMMTKDYTPAIGFVVYYAKRQISPAQFQPLCNTQSTLVGDYGPGSTYTHQRKHQTVRLDFPSSGVDSLQVYTQPEQKAVVGIKHNDNFIGEENSEGEKPVHLCCPAGHFLSGIRGVFYTGGALRDHGAQSVGAYYYQFEIMCDAGQPVCVTGDTEVRVVNSSSVTSLRPLSELVVGDFVLSDNVTAGTSAPARIEYISKSVVTQPTAVYGINGGRPFFTAQHELKTANGGCAMIDAAGWLERTSDFVCKPVELTIGVTVLMETDGEQLQPVVISSIEQVQVPAASVLYNVYLSSGWSLRGNGVLLSEPSRHHMREWYTNPARQAAQLSLLERAKLYRDLVNVDHSADGNNKLLYALQDSLWQSHAVQLERAVQAVPESGREAAVAALLEDLTRVVHDWRQSLSTAAPAASSRRNIDEMELTDYLHFVVRGELYENGAPKVWRDGVLYPTMYDLSFKLTRHVRSTLSAGLNEAAVQRLVSSLQSRLNDWCKLLRAVGAQVLTVA